jgi:hypothetical protein
MKDWIVWTIEPFADAGRFGLLLLVLAIPTCLVGGSLLVWGAVEWVVGWSSIHLINLFLLGFGWLVAVLVCAVPFRLIATIYAGQRYKNRKRRGLDD